MKAYFISGLGADRRVFKNIILPEGFETVYLDWIFPLQNESLKEYALRLARKIDKNTPFVLIGLSLGGMIASQISLQFKPRLTILISSVPVASDLPPYYHWARGLRLHHLIPPQLIKSAFLLKRIFTTETPDDKLTLVEMIKDMDVKFVRWAMNSIPQWKNDKLPLPYIHIHGTDDRILPLRFTKPTHIISKGGHLIIMNRAKEINDILKEELGSK